MSHCGVKVSPKKKEPVPTLVMALGPSMIWLFEPKQPLSRDRSLTERRSKALPELIEFFELLGPANTRSGTAVYYKSVPGYEA
jgi:hypothetical protein